MKTSVNGKPLLNTFPLNLWGLWPWYKWSTSKALMVTSILWISIFRL